jgi:hypothetical protein
MPVRIIVGGLPFFIKVALKDFALPEIIKTKAPINRCLHGIWISNFDVLTIENFIPVFLIPV